MSSILHADAELVVIDKPAGVPSVPLRAGEAGTAVALALEAHPELARVGEAVGKPLEAGLLHRLDSGTSGALAFARTPEAHERLRRAWKTAEVAKIYRALVSGEPPFPGVPRVIDTPIGRSAKSSKRMLALAPGRERQIRGEPLEAITHLLSARPVEFGACLRQLQDIEIRIETGVMHQIRCHLSSIGWPILGDGTYGGDTSGRLWLHAWKLVLPGRAGRIEIEAPLPADWPS
jgi:23S rRNA pseudouridine1911/1915/1917 synthase